MAELKKNLLKYALIISLLSCQQERGSNPMITVDSLEYKQLIGQNESLLKANTALQVKNEKNNKKIDSLISILPALETINEFKKPFSAFYLYPYKQNDISIGIKGPLSDSSEVFGDFGFDRLFKNIEVDLYSDSHYNTSYQKTPGEILLSQAGYDLFYGSIKSSYKFSWRNRALHFVEFTNHFNGKQIISVWEERNEGILFEGIIDIGFYGGEVGGYNKIDTMYHFRNRGVSGRFSDATIVEMSLGSGDEGYVWSNKRIGILYLGLELEIIYEESINGRYEESGEGFLEELIETEMDFGSDILTVTKIDRKQDGTETILKKDSLFIKEIVTSKIGDKRWGNF